MTPAKPSTLLSSPSQSSSEQLVTLNNVHQFIDIAKAVVAMEIAFTPTPKCSCSNAHSENAPSQPLTYQDLEQLILKLVDAKSKPPKPPKPPEGAKPDAHPEAA
jgi:hypothetical protein